MVAAEVFMGFAKLAKIDPFLTLKSPRSIKMLSNSNIDSRGGYAKRVGCAEE